MMVIKARAVRRRLQGLTQGRGMENPAFPLITHVEVELAHVSDADALYKAIKDEHGLSFHTS
ncbi:MAG: hypothetical protein ACP5SG_00205 [Dissulfurimicrobium sp.]|uniref:hypothetical protein n=1 Tax=Dissulfurimicrobium TaxID=1769732 RepID=UPI003C7795DE